MNRQTERIETSKRKQRQQQNNKKVVDGDFKGSLK